MMPMTTANSSHTMHKILLIRALANGRTRGLGFREERRSVNLRESSLKDLQALVVLQGLGRGEDEEPAPTYELLLYRGR
jgi:hypothetical protein